MGLAGERVWGKEPVRGGRERGILKLDEELRKRDWDWER